MTLVPMQELIIMGPKLVEAFFFILIAFVVKNRGGHSFKEQYYLNRTFFYSFISFFVYIVLDAFIFPFAALSFEGAPVGTYTGYPLEYPSLLIANILRDVAFLGGLLNMIIILVAAYQIRFGRAKCHKNLTHNKIFLISIIVLFVISVILDGLKVTIANGNDPGVNPVYEIPQIVILIGNIVLYFISAIALRKVMFIDMTENDRPLQQRLRFLSVGVFLMGIGYLFWIIKGILTRIPGIGSFINAYAIVFLLIGHAIWTLSPILMYLGLRNAKSDEPAQTTDIPYQK